MNELKDFALIKHSLKGDQAAFSEIVRRYQAVVATTAVNMLGNMEDAEEAGQQTFIRLYKSLKSFKGNSELKTYITRICINVCLSALKKRKKQRERIVSLDDHISNSLHDSKFEEDYENKELVAIALSRLDVNSRTIINLRMIQGYSTRETAEILSIAEGTVLSRLKRAMDKLKRILK
ncbi:MAG: RNA polymerase sigma factor [Bacteroidia bacterium]